MLNRLFGGDKEALQVVTEYEEVSRVAYEWLNNEDTGDEAYEQDMEAKSDRATDLFLSHGLYDYACYRNETAGIEETGLPED